MCTGGSIRGVCDGVPRVGYTPHLGSFGCNLCRPVAYCILKLPLIGYSCFLAGYIP